MNPRNPSQLPFDQVIVETLTGCLVVVAKSVQAAVGSLGEAGEPPESPPCTLADVPEVGLSDAVRSTLRPVGAPGSGGASSGPPAQRRRPRDDPTEQPSPAAQDMVRRFQMIIGIVESTRSRPEVGELLKAVQRLKLVAGELRPVQQKRRRCPSGSQSPGITAASGGRSSVSLLEETIGAIEQMRLSEPMEHSEEYADVLTKLKELLRIEEEDG